MEDTESLKDFSAADIALENSLWISHNRVIKTFFASSSLVRPSCTSRISPVMVESFPSACRASPAILSHSDRIPSAALLARGFWLSRFSLFISEIAEVVLETFDEIDIK